MITPQNSTIPVTPNAVLVPQIVISTKIINQKLVTSANVTLQPAYVDGSGNWQNTGFGVSCNIPDVNNLPTDLASMATDIGSLETMLLSIVDDLNSIRKLV